MIEAAADCTPEGESIFLSAKPLMTDDNRSFISTHASRRYRRPDKGIICGSDVLVSQHQHSAVAAAAAALDMRRHTFPLSVDFVLYALISSALLC